MNASVPTSAAKMAIALVRIKRVRATIPACRSIRILLQGLIVMTVLHLTLAKRMMDASVPMSAAKITIALVGTKRARATIPAPAYVTVLRCSFAMISVNVPVPMSAVTIATVPKAGSAL